MSKPTLLYMIDSLGRGGAETLLVGILKELSREYNIVLVTLTDDNEFDEINDAAHYSLGFTGKLSYPRCVLRLRKIIRETRPALAHAHLLNSSIVLRMACPRHIPVVYSLHSILSSGAFNGSWIYRNLEKMLFREAHTVIAVSENVLKDYETSIGRSQHAYVLKNYVGDQFIHAGNVPKKLSYANGLQLVAVGNIKKVKNYEYLLEAFDLLRGQHVSLDIYGSGDQEYISSLQQVIDEKKLPVKFMGPHKAVQQILPQYDFFVMSSTHEGFGIAAIEAMAAGLPLLLSDIPVLKDVTLNNAFFFNLNDPASFVQLVSEIKANPGKVQEMIRNGKEIVQQNYTREKYTEQLLQIYRKMLDESRFAKA